MLLIGAVGAVLVGAVMRQLGRNVVAGDGVVDAAFADDTVPEGAVEDEVTRLVSDAELDDMATVEFEPPPGLHPWQGAILLDEAVSSRSVSAWFAEKIATGVLELIDEPRLYLSKGPRWDEDDLPTEQYVRDIFREESTLSLGRYQPSIGGVWARLTADQNKFVKQNGWWVDRGPGTGNTVGLGASVAVVVGVPVMAVAALVVWASGWWSSWVVCAIAALALGVGAAAVAYEPLRARRSAQGSALALRTESFRRFLASSEGQHVDWAWERGVLREYTAWAVALGAAAAWGKAIDASAVPPSELTSFVPPAVFERHLSSIESARTPPPPPSTGGGGGGSSFSSSFSSSSSSSFSSGSVGGGGGGGSSGSW